MLARTLCYALIGVDGIPVTVETDVSGGTFKQVVVGLPDTAVKESTERVLAGLRNSGYAFPQGRVTVNLAPADVRKAARLTFPSRFPCSPLPARCACPRSRIRW